MRTTAPCAQSCRWKYALMEEKRPGQYFPVDEDERGTYLYNSKDMCMIDHIPELVAAGVTVVQNRGPRQDGISTPPVSPASYRRAVDAYFEHPAIRISSFPEDIARGDRTGSATASTSPASTSAAIPRVSTIHDCHVHPRLGGRRVCSTAAMRMAMRFLF